MLRFVGIEEMLREYKERIGCFILAGGEGSRLGNLTRNTCKPLIKVCSHYHLIDFSLINCLHFNITKLAVIVQYESIDLINYLFESNLNSLVANFKVMPPGTKQSSDGDFAYKNTAHSVKVNMDYMVDDDNIRDILILSADHVYSMDYDFFYRHHLEMDNDLTVSVSQVSLEEASRLGVFTLDEEDNIIDFEEKPENPKSNYVSMGIYLFKKDKLKEALIELEKSFGADLDFGEHVLPYFLENYKVGLYKFKWYWLDVGTVYSFWKLNMSLLDHPTFIKDFFELDKRFKINKDINNSSPSFFGENSNIKSSIIGKNSFVLGNVNHSMIGDGVVIEEDVDILNSVVMDNCLIKKGTKIKNAVISQDTVVEEDIISDDEIICK